MAGLCAGLIDIGTEWMNDLRSGLQFHLVRHNNRDSFVIFWFRF